MEKKKELEKVPVTVGVLTSLVEFCKRRNRAFLSSYDNLVYGAKQERERLWRTIRHVEDKAVSILRFYERLDDGVKEISFDEIVSHLQAENSRLSDNFQYVSDFYRGQLVASDHMLAQLRYLVDECCYTQENCKCLFEKQLAHYTGGRCEGFDNGYKQAYKEIIDFVRTGLKICIPVGCEI